MIVPSARLYECLFFIYLYLPTVFFRFVLELLVLCFSVFRGFCCCFLLYSLFCTLLLLYEHKRCSSPVHSDRAEKGVIIQYHVVCTVFLSWRLNKTLAFFVLEVFILCMTCITISSCLRTRYFVDHPYSVACEVYEPPVACRKTDDDRTATGSPTGRATRTDVLAVDRTRGLRTLIVILFYRIIGTTTVKTGRGRLLNIYPVEDVFSPLVHRFNHCQVYHKSSQRTTTWWLQLDIGKTNSPRGRFVFQARRSTINSRTAVNTTSSSILRILTVDWTTFRNCPYYCRSPILWLTFKNTYDWL